MTQAKVDMQLELEAESLRMGVAAYRAALEKGGDTGVTAGQALLREAMGPMVEALTGWLKVTSEGLASKNAGVYHFINQLDPEVVAWHTAHAAIGMLHERPSVTRVAGAISRDLEASINHDEILAANPKLARKVAQQIDRMANRNKLVFIRKGAEMIDAKFIKWETSERTRVGTLLLHLFEESTGLVARETTKIGKGKTSVLVRPTESCRRWLEESHARCELLAPARMPMVCRPRKWSGPFGGGYMTRALQQGAVKTRNKGYLTALKDHDMPWVYASMNALQETEWAINLPVHAACLALWEMSVDTAGLPSREGRALPERTWAEGETVDPMVLNNWKIGAAKVYEENKKSESKRRQVEQKLWTAQEMLDRGNSFYFVYNLDWRGRLYPVGTSLTPQGDDVAKGLLTFAKSSRLGDSGAHWLAVQCANSFGVDKVSFEDRISWTEANVEAIIECGRDPLAFRFWQEADSPFVFLAACVEFAKLDAWVQAGGAEADFMSNLPVAFDGSCNGLQNFSAMLLDEVGGAATGLVPTSKPADIYSAVKDATQAIIDRDAAHPDDRRIGAVEARKATATTPAAEARAGVPLHEVAKRWVGKMTRQLAKRNTMTVPYGVTKRGMRDQLFAEMTTSDSSERSADASYIAGCNYEAIGKVVVASRTAMDWLQAAAQVAASTGLPVRWMTPAGFLAVQDYRDDVGQELDFEVLGHRYRLTIAKDGDVLNKRKQSMGISPNFVHSLDAAHLMRTVLFCKDDGIVDFAMIHDSYGVPAGHAETLRDNLRQAFVEQYSQPVLEQFRDELALQLVDAGHPELVDELPELPAMGTLDLEGVRTSDYFFA